MSGEYATNQYGKFLNKRGFTPFQFSSRKLQMNTTQLGGLIPDNPISDLANGALSWYEMWINPEKVVLKRKFMQKQQHTAGSIVTFHYRPETIDMHVSGKIGWVIIGPQERDESITGRISGNMAMDNSPRIFLQRLRDMAEEPMYFVGLDGIEHYNTKFIKIYTKQYPNGVICEGYFVDFEVPESGEDAQTIDYTFNFTIESLTPMSILQDLAGMFANSKAARKIRGATSTLPGLQ